MSNSTFPTAEELSALLGGLLSDEEATQICERIRRFEPTDDKSRGIKLFLIEHNYNYNALIAWRKKAYSKLSLVSKSRTFRLSDWVKYAAAIVLLIVSIAVISNYSGTNNNDWKSYYKRDPGFPIYMSNSKGHTWMSEYRQGNYSAARQILEMVLRSGQNNDTLNYFYTICLFELNSLNEKNFPTVTADSPFYLKYRLLLAYYFWRNENINEATLYFNQLIQIEDTAISNNAVDALKKIRLRE
jgi:hypothetical protein